MIPEDLRRATADHEPLEYALAGRYGGLGAIIAQDLRLAFEFGRTAQVGHSLFGANKGIAGLALAKFDSPRKEGDVSASTAGEAIAFPPRADVDDAGGDTSSGPAAELYYSELVSRGADRVLHVFGGINDPHGTVVKRMNRDSRLHGPYESTGDMRNPSINVH